MTPQRNESPWDQIRPPNLPGPKVFVLVGVALLVGVGLWTSFNAVPAESVGVIQRFGRYARTVEPGLRFSAPFSIEKVSIVPIRRQLKQEFGFGTARATNRTQYSYPGAIQELERAMVTGDLNATLVEWIVQYRIRDAKEYLFHIRQPGETLRDVSESVMREVVGDRTVDEVITFGRQEIEAEALSKLQNLVNKYQIGLSIDQVQLKNVNPPGPVQASFNEVNQAQQERERAINIANGQYNKIIPNARGKADQRISEAAGYAAKRVNEAEGDASRFKVVFSEYLKAPDVTKRRLYLETMQNVAPNIGQKIVLDEDIKQFMPLLPITGKGAK
ncbi:MAG: FtsH protease activity modulator HflK [Pseudomonadota bacterium]